MNIAYEQVHLAPKGEFTNEMLAEWLEDKLYTDDDEISAIDEGNELVDMDTRRGDGAV